jgi:hypothetical protein
MLSQGMWPAEAARAQMHERKLCEVLADIAPKGRALAVVRAELTRKGISASYYEHKHLDRYGDDAELRKNFRSILIVAAKRPAGVLVSYNEMIIVGFDKAQNVKEVRCEHFGFGP